MQVRSNCTLAPTYARLLADESEGVRVAVLSASAAIMSAIAPDDGHPVAARFVGASRDRSAAVRVAVAEILPGVANVGSEASALTREIAATLIDDSDRDVRVAMALQAAILSDGAGHVFVSTVILPTLSTLVQDESVGDRAELAAVLMSLAAPFGATKAASLLLPIVQLLLEDTNTNVRLSVIYRLGTFVQERVALL